MMLKLLQVPELQNPETGLNFQATGCLSTPLGAKLFVIAGPVLVYGISASVIYGLILFLTGGGSV